MKVHYNSQHSSSGNPTNFSSGSTSTSNNSKSKSSNKPQKHFEAAKKGEVNELKQLLKNTINDKDEKKKREIVKKVIAYMTLGIDVSRLFSEMCMHSYTNDLIQKKMIYLYLTNYAEQNPEDVVMAINTFRKDCGHKDAKIRGLALRSLCSLRFSGSFDYLMPAIQDALKDLDPYVRKVAVLGCLKVFYVSPDTIKSDLDILDQLYKMIRDNDPLVICNAISALQEIQESEFQVSTKMVIYLLNRLKEFPEFSQVKVLELTALYKPKTEQETFDIMNLLDERLRHSCISIVLATIKIFLNYTANNPKITESVYKRIKAPLLTLLSSCEMSQQFEIAYTVLKHIQFLVSKGAAQYFYNEYKHFYIKADETSYIKLTKLDILSNLANENNIGDMLNELGEYVTDVDHEMARNSIATLGSIAIRISEMAVPIVKQLSTFVGMKTEYITNQTVIVFKDILRKHPEHFSDVGEVITQAIDYVTEPESKVALFWILGEFGVKLESSPYILENFVLTEENQEFVEVKHALLTACTKLFVQKPPEMQETLGLLYKNILGNEQEDIDLRDRAAYYYRAMQNNIQEFKQLILQDSDKVIDFAEDDEDQKIKDTLSLNTLSIIYNKPSDKYTKSYKYFSIQRNKEAAEELGETPENQEEEEEQQQQQQEQQQQETPQQQVEEFDILNQDIPPQGQDQQTFGAPTIKGITLDDLQENFAFGDDDFENNWERLEDGATFTRMTNPEVTVSEDQLEELFKYYRIYSVASGEEDGSIKFYMYSKHIQKNQVILVEAEFNLNNKTVTIITKSDDEELAQFYSKYIEELMKYSNLLVV